MSFLLSQKFGALVMLLTKRLEVIRASVDEALKPSVKGMSVTRTVLFKKRNSASTMQS